MQRNKTQNCTEVLNLKAVRICPTSSDEYDRAANKTQCSKQASQLNCSTPDKYKYHCVINSFKNETVEACAPEKNISGKIFVYSKPFMINNQTDCTFHLTHSLFDVSMSLPFR